VEPTREAVLEALKQANVHFLRLQFCDVMGIIKNVEVPQGQFEKALAGEVMFDGSAIEGFVRIEESDMRLQPDLNTFAVFPWVASGKGVARLICDVHTADGRPFAGDPRWVLRRQIEQAERLGFRLEAGVEAEFFLFQRREDGSPTVFTPDAGGYFDLTPVDVGEVVRRDIVSALDALGFDVETAHHEVAPGQHEIDFRHEDVLTTADRLTTFKFVVRSIAAQHGLHATFMPKPINGQAGSGLHTHQALYRGEENAFYDPSDPEEMSAVLRHYVGGLLRHARSFTAVTNPLVNSYKRLVSGYEAPVNVAWSQQNRSPLIRVPGRQGAQTRVEVRLPDPSANPYLALAVQLAAGLDGIRRKVEPPEPVNKDIQELSVRERRRHRIQQLPRDLGEALDQLRRSAFMREVLGDHVFQQVLNAGEQEWREYIAQVHDWELERYLGKF